MTAWQRANDAELISAVRDDDLEAWAELCHRHLEAARRLARALVPAKDADDLVERAFERVRVDLRRGEGPDVALRPHLLAAVRSEQRSLRAVAGEDRPAVRAYRALPERWQLVLWHVGVERDQPSQVAPLAGAADSAVRGMVGRARAGLRAETLNLYDREADALGPECEWTREHLAAHLRGATTRRESGSLETHLQTCSPCRAVRDELAAIDDDLAGILGPVVLGTAAADYLTMRKAGAFARHPGRAALVGVAAAVVLITGVALGLGGSPDDPPAAEAPPIGSPSASLQPTERGITLEPSASGEPDDDASPAAPGGSPAAPGSVSPTSTPLSPPPSSGGPSDDSTLTPPDTSGPPSSPPPTTPPPTTPPPPAVDPAVTARLPASTGPVARIEVLVEDVAETDGRLTVASQDPGVEFLIDRRCTPLEGTSSLVCNLANDARPVEILADLSAATGHTLIEFGITPKPGVETDPDQLTNNRVVVALPPPNRG